MPRKIVLFPVRKYVELFGAVRGVPQDVMQVMLLARTVHRCLERGLLVAPDRMAGGSRAERKAARRELQAGAERIRRAFELAVAGMDLTLLSGALADGLSQGRGLSTAAVGYARRLVGRSDADGERGADRVSVPRPDAEVEEGAEEIERIWVSPKVARLLREFDARFDAVLAGGSAPGRADPPPP